MEFQQGEMSIAVSFVFVLCLLPPSFNVSPASVAASPDGILSGSLYSFTFYQRGLRYADMMGWLPVK